MFFKDIVVKYKKEFLYLLCGILTTVVNVAVYFLLYEKLYLGNIISVILAWIIAVLVAFFSNKHLVFMSKRGCKETFRELAKFVVCRILSGVFELIFMFVTVDILKNYGPLMKIVVTFFVFIINYVFSAKVVFYQKDCN